MKLKIGMRKVLRFLWILVINGIIVRMTFTSIFGDPLNPMTLNRDNWLEFALKTAIPVFGIVLELTGASFARWVNVGFPVAVGIFFSVEAARSWSDPFHGVLVLLSLGLFIMAGLTELIYRFTASDRLASASTTS